MEFGITIIGIIIVLICIVPFAWMSISRNRKQKKFLRGLSEIARQNNCTISRFESWNNSAIGIDDTALRIVYARRTNNGISSEHINLADIQKCRIINSGRTVSNKGSHYNVVDKLELGFSFRDPNRKEVLLELYSTEHDNLTLNGELLLGEKWCQLVNDKISGVA